ncbi:cytochrome P450 [Colletotrichum eremochloae]|nr:cytochrome P450 [Colletotrichum eremochloae]
MGYVYTALILLPCLFVVSHLWTLQRNYRAALLTGLPIIVFPYDPDSAIHLIFSVPLRPVLRRLLPARVYNAISLVISGWEFCDESAVHDRVGPAFVIVTTSQNQLICADPAMAQVILAKRNYFVQGDFLKRFMGFLGSNVQTSNGDSWSRQRRIVATALNERISPSVWKETAAQATSLADFLLCSSSPSGWTADTIPGLRAVAVNVLSHIAYGIRKPFSLITLPRDPKADMTYVDGISLCASLLAVAALAPRWLLRLPVMPKLLQTIAVARERLPGLTRDILDQERRRAAEETASGADGRAGPRPTMSLLVRLSDQEKKQQQAASDAAVFSEKKADPGSSAMINKTYLTEDEISGNLFIFTIAGFDTTANTLAFAVTLLAAYPEWQAWIQAEIDAVLGPAPAGAESDDELPDYAAAYPNLVRCLAVMFEVLHLFPPTTHLMRSTETAQTMPYPSSSTLASASSPSTFTLGAAPSDVYINTVALHTAPSTWGPDALTFNPSRWLQSADAAAAVSGEEEGEVKKGGGGGDQSPASQFITPPRGTYFPWSGGPCACPGQKMSQVEFVTVMATLFRSQPVITLQMKRPNEVRLRWARR